MRDLIDIIMEKGLSKPELALTKHEGAYLKKLAQLAVAGPVAVEPSNVPTYGPTVTIAPETLKAIDAGITGAPLPNKPMFVLDDGRTVPGTWSAINKGAEYTGLEGKKPYNTGHLAELFMGLSVTAKFFNLGHPITVAQLVDTFTFSQVSSHTNPKTNKLTSNIVFTIGRDIVYPASIKGNPDHLTFRGVIPGKSADAFMKQVKTRQFAADIQSVMASAVRYVNEAPGVENSIKQTQADPNTNQINVTSDGTSDAKMTKADLSLTVDSRKVNLLSLKTYSSDTLGQISGVTFAQVSQWFMTSFGIDISEHKNQIESAKTPADGFEVLLNLYDIYFPEIKATIERQTPGGEAEIVKHLSRAANFHARGASGEDVEIVKLDDKIKEGNYKILRFSDDLVDAMDKLDLEATMSRGQKNRTIQIWVKPDESNGLTKANKLCQFRTQKMGKAYRNYFESGDMLEKLTQIGDGQVKEANETELQTVHGVIPNNQPTIRKDNIKVYGRGFQK